MKKEELPKAEEMCKRDGTKQCAAICLQYSCLIPLGECPAIEIVWTDKAIRNHLKRKSRNPVHIALPLSRWHEDLGTQLWWVFPISEPPYCGSPLCDDWPGYHTHFTSFVIPAWASSE